MGGPVLEHLFTSDGPDQKKAERDMGAKTAAAKNKPSRERIYDLLMNARTVDQVELHFQDGRNLVGAIIFNEFKGTGRLINIDEEVSLDFRVEELRDVRF